MLDKIRGKKKDDKDTPDLRGNNNKKDDSDIGGRLKGMVGKVTGKGDEDKKEEMKTPPERKMPRPMPKPMAKPGAKPGAKPRLKPPQKRPEDKRPGMGGFGRRIPDDDQKTLVGAAVFGIILIVLVGAGYYFLVYAPYQDTLSNAKQTKLAAVNTYFTGPLATDARGINLRAQISSATTPDQVDAIDVLGPATEAWREYQNQQINTQKDAYGRVMITYNDSTGTQKNSIVKVTDAKTIVNQADATVLSQMVIKTPDTVAIPIIISRLQAAGGLINVGNSVDVYLMNGTTSNTTVSTTNGTPQISGATVLAILRAKDSGTINANKSHAQTVAMSNLVSGSSRSESASEDVDELLKAAAANNWDQTEVSSLLNSY
ncbi:MAG: DUF515 domain-containing protein, partial [Methanobacterium sp.]